MRVLIYVLADSKVGFGHWYRCQALAEELDRAGHQVRIATNNTMSREFLVEGVPSGPRLAHLFMYFLPDYVVFDLNQPLADYVPGLCRSYGVKSITLLREPGPDLIFAQDTPENMILRRAFWDKPEPGGVGWLVFGGTGDRLGLRDYFTNLGILALPACSGERFVTQVQNCRKACVSFGMIAWELAACKKPQYIFSIDGDHLHSALKMQATGLALAWPTIGLPKTTQEFQAFLGQRFEPRGQRPDGQGALRLISLLARA